MVRCLLRDEAGFIISAELVLVATILVIGLIVGLSEVQHSVIQELNDVGDAIGNINQSYYYGGFLALKSQGVVSGIQEKARTNGSSFVDTVDECDNDQCSIACAAPVAEGPKP